MKKMMIMAMMMVMTISANAMSYNAAMNEALFNAPAAHHNAPAPVPRNGKPA